MWPMHYFQKAYLGIWVSGTSSVVVWTTSSLLLFQYCLSPVICWQWQPTVKDVFLIILHSLNTAVTIADARMHTKLLCHVKIKQKHFKKIWNLWSLFLRNIEILLFVVVVFDNWNCSTATRIKTHCRTKHHPSKLKKKAKKWRKNKTKPNLSEAQSVWFLRIWSSGSPPDFWGWTHIEFQNLKRSDIYFWTMDEFCPIKLPAEQKHLLQVPHSEKQLPCKLSSSKFCSCLTLLP